MLFDTPVYLLFLTVVVLIYWRLNRRRQNVFLLGASYFFYGWWDWRFLILMAVSTVFDYFIALSIATAEDGRRRKALLTLSLVLNFGFLGYFKYYNFFADSASGMFLALGFGSWSLHVAQIVLPPAISFYTFQEVAYIVDVYSRKLEPAHSLIEYALFISLFPHLIAGPIQRPSHLLPQVQRERLFDPSYFFDGLLLIVSGLFRKCVIADQCALIANAVFDGRLGHNAAATALGVYAFAWQIYADFSAYSDFARGSAQLMGFHFMVNFRQPYLATSFQDFWRRWHISLSTWLRDYLYIPLGGKRHGTLKTYRNLMVTMLLGGLWHGANWTFVVWGGLHGAGLSAERWLGIAEWRIRNGLEVWVRRLLVFTAVCFAWIFFRAVSLTDALRLIGDLTRWEWREQFPAAAGVLAVVSGLMLLMDLRLEHTGEEYVFQSSAEPRRVAAAMALLVMIVLFSASQSSAFIYFQF